jgi:hypothetical protein
MYMLPSGPVVKPIGLSSNEDEKDGPEVAVTEVGIVDREGESVYSSMKLVESPKFPTYMSLPMNVIPVAAV